MKFVEADKPEWQALLGHWRATAERVRNTVEKVVGNADVGYAGVAIDVAPGDLREAEQAIAGERAALNALMTFLRYRR